MKCACCGRKKKLLESFENLGEGGDVCVDCSDIMYRIHDAYTEKNRDEHKIQVKKIEKYFEKKKASDAFIKWFMDDFMKRNTIPEEKE